MIRREHFPDGASGGGPLVVLHLTGHDRPTAVLTRRRFTECWVTVPNTRLTNGKTDEYLTPDGGFEPITATLNNEIIRARHWCLRNAELDFRDPKPRLRVGGADE